MDTEPPPLIVSLDDPTAGVAQVGGKGASLARLARAGMPVPAGFHITTAAYRRFVTQDGIQDRILAAVSQVTADRPATFEAAAQQIAPLFAQRADARCGRRCGACGVLRPGWG